METSSPQGPEKGTESPNPPQDFDAGRRNFLRSSLKLGALGILGATGVLTVDQLLNQDKPEKTGQHDGEGVNHDSEHSNAEDPHVSEQEMPTEEEVAEQVDHLSSKIEAEVHKIEVENPEMERYESTQRAINLVASANFGWGIANLIAGHPISKTQYATTLSLLFIKYSAGDEHEKHHITEELKTGAIATLAISAMVMGADAMKADYQAAFEDYRTKRDEKEAERGVVTSRSEIHGLKEDVAMVMSLAATLSPGITTLGSTGMLGAEAHALLDRIEDNIRQRKISAIPLDLSEAEQEVRLEAIEEEVEKEASEIRATLIAHIANMSGLLFLGDPPFIAAMLNFGPDAIAWQFKNLLPLAVNSLRTSCVELFQKIDPEGSGYNAQVGGFLRDTLSFSLTQAAKTYANILGKGTAIPSFVTMLARSIKGGEGIQAELFRESGHLSLIDFLSEKANSVTSLVTGKHLPDHHHGRIETSEHHAVMEELKDGLTAEEAGLLAAAEGGRKVEAAERGASVIPDMGMAAHLDPIGRQLAMRRLLMKADPVSTEEEVVDETETSVRVGGHKVHGIAAIFTVLYESIEEGEFEDAHKVLEQLTEKADDKYHDLLQQVRQALAHLEALSNSQRVDIGNLFQGENGMLKDALMGVYGVVWKNNFSFDRSHAALGPNLTEVLNAFPFQVLHAPFLGPLLKDFLGGVDSVVHSIVSAILEASPIKIKITAKMQKSLEGLFQDMIAYTSIWIFSSIADNYLGADLGFKAMDSEKALIPLTASITGGKNTPIGNMANMNLFSLSENGFAEHMRAIFGTQLSNDAVAMFYSIFVTRIQETVDSMVPSILKLTPPEKRGEVEKHLNEKIQGAKAAAH